MIRCRRCDDMQEIFEQEDWMPCPDCTDPEAVDYVAPEERDDWRAISALSVGSPEKASASPRRRSAPTR
jgi:hypothetical protein